MDIKKRIKELEDEMNYRLANEPLIVTKPKDPNNKHSRDVTNHATIRSQYGRKITCLRKYGCENAVKNSEVRQKIKDGVNKTWTEERRKKRSQEWKDILTPEVLEKRKKTAKENYTEELKERKSKILKKVWEDRPELREAQSRRATEMWQDAKTRETKLKGIAEANKDPEVSMKRSIKSRAKWQDDEIRDRMVKHMQETAATPESRKKKSIARNSDSYKQKRYETMKNNNSFNTSNPELRVKIILESNFNSILYQYKSTLYPFDCDFYIEDLDLYIECNFTWLHGEFPYNEDDQRCKDKLFKWQEKAEQSNYYKNAIYTWTDLDVRKLEAFKNNNLSYKIFYKENEVYTWIKDQLGYIIYPWDRSDIYNVLKGTRETLYARNLTLREVQSDQCDQFLNDNHLQGTCKGQDIRLGLYKDDLLVEIMTFGKPRYNKNFEYELLRLCTIRQYNIVGGADKIFKYFINNYSPSSVISYCDNSKFNGSVYDRLGFVLKSKGNPSKHWFNFETGRHITDNLLNQRGFSQLHSDSKYINASKGDSNRELMIENGYIEIYDIGQSTYVYQNQ